MKRTILALAIYLLIAGSFAISEVRPNFSSIGGISAGAVLPASLADDDFGDWTCSSGVCTLDADTVATSELANGAVAALNLADADFGIFSVASGVASMDSWRGTGGILMCAPGAASAAVCQAYTDLGASFTSIGTDGIRIRDLSTLHQYRLSAVMSAAAVTGDLAVECDLDPAFGSVDGTMDSSGTQICTGTGPCAMAAWVAIPAACQVDDIWLRFGMINGNTTEDPALRSGEIEFR